MNTVFNKLKKEFNKLDHDLQVHALMLINIVEELSIISKRKPKMDVIAACAVLHDSMNHEPEHAKAGAVYAGKVLKRLKFPDKFINRVHKTIYYHTVKPKTTNFTTNCFFDADILCRFYALGVLRAWSNAKQGRSDWKKLFLSISDENQLIDYFKKMKRRLQLKVSKTLMDSKKQEFLDSHKLLKNLVF